MAFNLILRPREDEPLYPRSVAARLAQISLEFLCRCEKERLIRLRVRSSGQGYSVSDIQELARIRRLREELGLNLPAVEVVLHLRRRVVELLNEVDEMEQVMVKREQALLQEIQELRRRLAEESDWQS